MRSSSCLVLCASLLLCASTVFGQVVVDIDVKPGSETNPINVRSKGKTPVALLCAPGFDPATVEHDSLMVGMTSALRCTSEDVNADACLDLLCQVATQALGLTCLDTEITVTGLLTDGMTTLSGADVVTPIGCKAPKKPPKLPKEPKTPKTPKAPTP